MMFFLRKKISTLAHGISPLILMFFLSSMQPFPSTKKGSKEALDEVQSVSQRQVLEIFFREFFEESQGGYVLYGSKPICVEGILPKETNLFILGNNLHKRNVTLKEGFKVWKKLNCKSQNYYVRFYEKPSYGWQHLVLINREVFLRAVQQNLPLFQYILGPELSPEGLLEKLMDPEESFSSVFHDNKVLIGIALGFGTQNALHVSREESIEDSLAKREKVPFKPLNFRLEEVGNNSEVAPSFGYSSLKEEIDHLNKSLFVSKELVEESLHPIPWFGCLKNKETSQLLKEYSKSQKKIEEVLRENHFLERVLGKFEGTKFFEIPFNSPLNDLDSEFKKSVNWSFLIAQAINQGLPEHDQEWIESFIKGMQAQENGEVQLSSQQWYHLLDSHREIEKALESKQNLIQCENFFSRLQDKKDLKCLFPGKLYYKIIKEGEGEVVETPFSTVQINYVIKDHLDTILYAVQASETGPIDMSNLIDGMAIGIRGMATGEEREIYIHPAFGYGESSNFSPNVGLVAQIKLVGIVTQEKEMDKQPLIPLEISACAMDEAKIIEKEQLLRNEIAFHLGGKTWSHFRKGQKAGYNLDSIIEAFLQENKSEPIADLSFEADELLTALHWRIYHTPDLDSKFVTKG